MLLDLRCPACYGGEAGEAPHDSGFCAELARIGSGATEAAIGAHAEPVCSDVATRRTRAERAEEGWIVSDENNDSSNGVCADSSVKPVRRSASGSRSRSSLLTVERCEDASASKLEQPGYRLGYKLGCCASNTAKNAVGNGFACEQNAVWAPNRPGRSDAISPAEYSFGDVRGAD